MRIRTVPVWQMDGGVVVIAEDDLAGRADGPDAVHDLRGLRSITDQIAQADFDGFWQRQMDELATVPLRAELVPIDSTKPGFAAFAVRIDCAGGMPVTGHLTRPVDATVRALAGRVGFMGGGVMATPIEYFDGTICLIINAHGIEPGREPAYYQALGGGALKDYLLRIADEPDPDRVYLHGMALRALRAVAYLRSLPEWNGRDLVASGVSQGGLQALWAAALDPAVSACTVWKPWCCGIAGPPYGSRNQWRPVPTPALAYYDPVHHAGRIRCQLTITAALGDDTCPPAGITALFNACSGPRTVTYIQGASHVYQPPGAERSSLAAP